jgi:antitoxin (DNA-binding transcriptional repressor) of toxin-antitoxin stability system
MAHRLDQGEVVRITRRGVPIGHYVPITQPFPAAPSEIEPDDPPDEVGPIVLAMVTASDGPRINVSWSSSARLSLPELLGDGD